MFALLQHETRDPAGQPEIHWDLLVEVAGQERLATWRLARNPAQDPLPISAERIADHRRAYLDYEGPIRGDRGIVRRLDRGAARFVAVAHGGVAVELTGRHLRGEYAFVTAANGTLEFSAVGADGGPTRPVD